MSSSTIVLKKRLDDVYKALEGWHGTRFTREETMEIMEQIFVSRLLIGMRPLQGFRELPYNWQHHKFPNNLTAPKTRRQMYQYVSQSDLIWVLPGNELITARNEKRTKTERPFVWIGGATPRSSVNDVTTGECGPVIQNTLPKDKTPNWTRLCPRRCTPGSVYNRNVGVCKITTG
jgi:hypothetical protein